MRVAVLGTGKMGAAAARRLAAEGFDVTVWNRTRSRAEAVGAGRVAESAAEAVAGSEVTISILTGPAAVRAVYADLDPEEPRVYLEMSTAGPEVPEELSQRFRNLVSAPVVAPPRLVEAGKALFLAGGPDAAIDTAQPVFDALGEVRRVDTPRRAAAMKLLNNTMLAVTNAAAAELVEAAVRSGLTAEEAFEWMVRHAPYLDSRRSGFVGGPYAPVTFALKDMLKDVNLALEMLDGPGFPMPIVEAVRDGFAEVLDTHGEEELTAVNERYKRVPRA